MKRLLAMMSVALLLLSCGSGEMGQSNPRLPLSWGHKQKIYVLADSPVWNVSEEVLRETLERPIFTTFNEKEFELERADFKDLEQFYKFNNVVFLGNVNSNNDVAVYLRDYLSEHVINEVKENGAGIYVKNDLWARNQMVMFLLGDSKETVQKLIKLQSNRIYAEFDETLHQRIKQQVYKQKQYDDSVYADFPWTLKLTKNYVPYRTDTANRFISFIARLRNKPDRYIAVYYEKIPEEEFTRDWLKATRARLAWKYYDEDEIAEDKSNMRNYRIADTDGLRFGGLWQNQKYAVGGPFQTFAFYHQPTGTAYVIDNSIYWPEGYKLPGLIELEEIAKTIRIK
jgi:hypothetical protein